MYHLLLLLPLLYNHHIVLLSLPEWRPVFINLLTLNLFLPGHTIAKTDVVIGSAGYLKGLSILIGGIQGGYT